MDGEEFRDSQTVRRVTEPVGDVTPLEFLRAVYCNEECHSLRE